MDFDNEQAAIAFTNMISDDMSEQLFVFHSPVDTEDFSAQLWESEKEEEECASDKDAEVLDDVSSSATALLQESLQQGSRRTIIHIREKKKKWLDKTIAEIFGSSMSKAKAMAIAAQEKLRRNLEEGVESAKAFVHTEWTKIDLVDKQKFEDSVKFAKRALAECHYRRNTDEKVFHYNEVDDKLSLVVGKNTPSCESWLLEDSSEGLQWADKVLIWTMARESSHIGPAVLESIAKQNEFLDVHAMVTAENAEDCHLIGIYVQLVKWKEFDAFGIGSAKKISNRDGGHRKKPVNSLHRTIRKDISFDQWLRKVVETFPSETPTNVLRFIETCLIAMTRSNSINPTTTTLGLNVNLVDSASGWKSKVSSKAIVFALRQMQEDFVKNGYDGSHRPPTQYYVELARKLNIDVSSDYLRQVAHGNHRHNLTQALREKKLIPNLATHRTATKNPKRALPVLRAGFQTATFKTGNLSALQALPDPNDLQDRAPKRM
ncbi:hypothetical protein BKA62DRAFT_772115 [Auriculariales sp. MPI-PUGE-AT-0066]|nr:hypothetical protein BKA62DRAFT_772115 [Auriculariales sp. MPI-PUGE-AT-0066]